ncbi:hypothetical protein PInf_019243 [Phytophthora infestans]|nr:hypothetical protein PInf_019243 [Phytophthora infestans]
MRLLSRQISYRACVVIFLFLGSVAFITPFKEYYLGNYVTDPFDEIRDEVVARKLNQMGVVISGAHYYDTFDRKSTPLIDLHSRKEPNRSTTETLGLTDFLDRANVRRVDLLSGLPVETLSQPVNLMVDVMAPLCTDSWETKAQLLFGNYFPAIHHFNDELVVRKIMKNVQEGYMQLELDGYTDEVADAIVGRYSKGIAVDDAIALLPSSFDADHVALVDVLGVSALPNYYLQSQELTMGTNVNGEAAISAEVTHATAAYFTPDFLSTTVG